MIDTTSLKVIITKGVFWLFVQNIFTKLLYFFVTVWLARILFPADFGIMATSVLVINFLNIFVDFGVSQVVVQSKDKELEMQSTGFWTALFFGVTAVLGLLIFAPLIAFFFKDASLSLFLRVMSIDVLLTTLEILPIAVINKDMAFRLRVVPEVLFVFIFGMSSLVLAYIGYGAWSLVFGNLAGHFVRVVAYWLSAKVKIAFVFDNVSVKRIIGYGYNSVGISLILLILINGDNAFVKKMLGSAELGFYSLAYALANLPATHLTHIFGTITFPMYSKLQDNVVDMDKAFRKVLRMVTAISVPSSIGIIVLAPLIVEVLYGTKWSPMIVPLQLLAIFGMVRSILSICGNVFYAINEHAILKKITFFQVIIMVLTMYSLTKWFGIIGTALAINIAQFFAMILIFLSISKLLQGNIMRYVGSLLRTFAAASIMGGVVYVLYTISLTSIPITDSYRLLLLICTGVLAYFLSILFINKSLLAEFVELLKIFIGNVMIKWNN